MAEISKNFIKNLSSLAAQTNVIVMFKVKFSLQLTLLTRLQKYVSVSRLVHKLNGFSTGTAMRSRVQWSDTETTVAQLAMCVL